MAPTRECVSCADDEADGATVLYDTECGAHHFMCAECLHTLFKLATKDEKHYPPRCCNDETSVLLISKFEEVLPFEVAWDFQAKEAGEYSINPKYRVYCANANCATFLHPETHQTHTTSSEAPSSSLSSSDSESSASSGQSSKTSLSSVTKTISYAPCDFCSTTTCTSCKTVIEKDVAEHECQVSENEKKFKLTVEEKGYQECYNCGSTVELSEACNHISCECGSEFCYICGKEWEGLHGCPHYGPAEYDAEGYNQEGFHKETGLNRDGRTRRQQINHDRGANDDDDSDDDGAGRPRIPFPPELQQAVDNGIIPFEEAFEQWQISMIETGQFVDVNQFLQQHDDGDDGDDDGEDREEDENLEGEADNGGQDEEGAAGDEHDDGEDNEESDVEAGAQWPGILDIEPVPEASGDIDGSNPQTLQGQDQLAADIGDWSVGNETQGQDDIPSMATITWSLPPTANDDDAADQTAPLDNPLTNDPTSAKDLAAPEQTRQDPNVMEGLVYQNFPMPYAPEDEL
ncbi:hypothetical protein BDV96DRAFT_693520 [Lophiotrema nucula]|uniref:RING-type domain-containing protein n=1 Tax=Lophiotrema nucula TaxID=690887 RepID=A0A6A5YJY3_9PLEO|nr:hypothetical protein BDV96DRAFT_693520 [Lophiotrema nucula]